MQSGFKSVVGALVERLKSENTRIPSVRGFAYFDDKNTTDVMVVHHFFALQLRAIAYVALSSSAGADLAPFVGDVLAEVRERSGVVDVVLLLHHVCVVYLLT
jgi:hypothetical protein